MGQGEFLDKDTYLHLARTYQKKMGKLLTLSYLDDFNYNTEAYHLF
jgi:hypothetical protein